MAALLKPRLISVEEYLGGEEHSDVKHEYIGGAVHAMSGATNRHNAISLNALSSLYVQLKGQSCRPFNSDTKVRIELPSHTRFYYPDGMVVGAPNAETDHFQDRPVVIIEVLSESTRRVDLTEKREAYLTLPSLRVLVFLETEKPEALVYRRDPSRGFQPETYAGSEAIIDLPEISAALPLEEVYA